MKYTLDIPSTAEPDDGNIPCDLSVEADVCECGQLADELVFCFSDEVDGNFDFHMEREEVEQLMSFLEFYLANS